MASEKTYRYQAIYTDLKQAISNGTYGCDDLLPPESYFVSTYGVDRSTVRRGLQMLVDEGLVEKRPGKGTVVVSTAPPKVVKPSTKSNTIGFLLARGNSITEQFYSTLFCGMEDHLQPHGFNLVYATLSEGDNLKEMIDTLHLDGVVFVSGTSEGHLSLAVELGIPCVLVNSYSTLMPSIFSDNKHGAYLATCHLLDLGHRDILMLSGVQGHLADRERYQGFCKAHQDRGIPVSDVQYLAADSWEWDRGMGALSAYLEGEHPTPTAIFALNERLAFGAMQACKQSGLRVPQDVSVMGYDNLNNLHRSLFRLTTIETHVDLMAQAAIANLFWQFSGGQRLPLRITLPVSVVEGETANPL